MDPDLFDFVVDLLDAYISHEAPKRPYLEVVVLDEDDAVLGTYGDPPELAHEILTGTEILDLHVERKGGACPFPTAEFASFRVQEI